MNKKFLTIVLVFVMLMSCSYGAFASEKLTSETFTIVADIEKPEGSFNVSDLRFNLFSENGQWLGNKCVRISEPGPVEIVFSVPKYEIGAKFGIVATTGAEYIKHCETKYLLNEKFTEQTYAQRNEDGELKISDGANVSVMPLLKKSELSSTKFTIYADVREPDGLLVESDMRFNLFSEDGQWLGNQCVRITKTGVAELEFIVPEYQMGTKFMIAATTGVEYASYYGTKHPLEEKFLVETYAFRDKDGELVISDGVNISVGPMFKEDTWYADAEKHVNEKNIKSNTDYLIWVSKKDYRVSVFARKNGSWECIKYFGCSIGAPSTPTITGEYNFIERQSRWDYGTYYCGPIMRFYRGYAIHSTLLYQDGTDYDGRIGKQISHGCIRVRPENINWLMKTIPLQTKIYITN